jgi:penicillin-binding protein 1A
MVKKTKTNKKKTTKHKNQESWKRKFLRWGFVLSIWAALILIAVLAWYGKDLNRIAKNVQQDEERIVRVYANDGETELAAYGLLRGDNVRVEDLPEHIPNAFIAIEDRRFYSHFGIDLIGLSRAMVSNIQAGGIVQGGSTLTQQLAKNLFFTPERTIERKIQEAMLSIWIERKYSKEEILSAYLNHVYFGAGAYGLASAAKIYFDKEPEDLGLKEAALLAGLMQAPSRLAPTHNPEGAIERMRVVLRAMEDTGLVTSEMIADAQAIRITDGGKVEGMDFAERDKHPRYFADWVNRQVGQYIDNQDSNLKVITTLSTNIQNRMADIVRQQLDSEFPDSSDTKRPEAAAILLNENGAIRALIGGYDYGESQFNRVTDGNRQAGSAFKPFVYLAAIEQGWSPEDLISNEKIEEGRYRPSNYDGFYSLEVPLRAALANSYNVSAIYMMKEVGVKHVVDLAKRLGIDGEVREELSTALGTVDIPLLDLVGAYATIGQDGRQIEPYGIERIETENGRVLYERKNALSPRVIAYRHADAITSMMEDVIGYGTGKRAATGFPVAGKTGTTQNYRDAIFVGFSDIYTLGVWMGHDDNQSMGKGFFGGGVPATIWRKSMQAAHERVRAGPISNYQSNEDEAESFIRRLFSGGREREIEREKIGGEVIYWEGSDSNNRAPSRDQFDFNP